VTKHTRNSATADKPRDAFRGQSRSPTFDFRLQKCRDLEIGVTGHWRWYLSIDWVWFPISVL